jgi:predicted AlkP superfamily phosphohydrolase/phosphomutase
MNAASGPLIVLGLDGLPLALAGRLAEQGICPALGRLLPRARSLSAELPALSPVNWTSFFTASGPEDHGVFGFTRINAESYEISLGDFTLVRKPTLSERLGEAGLRSRVVNLPNTYPARPIEGMMISGFVALERGRSFFPPFLGSVLGDYVLEADSSRAAADPRALLRGLQASLASRGRAFERLWPDQDWDLFILTLTETDRLFHFCWDAVTDAAHPLHGDCAAFLREWDAVVGRVLDVAECLNARLMALADHGFAELEAECDCNSLLRKTGLLIQTLPPEKAPETDGACIDPRSAAFALDPGRIYLNTRRRFAGGVLSDEEAAMLLPRLREELLRLRRLDKPVFSGVLPAGELYKGPMLPYAPDLVCVPARGIDLKAKFNRPEIFGRFGRSGTHSEEDAFFYDSGHSRPARPRDAGRAVLEHFGLEHAT